MSDPERPKRRPEGRFSRSDDSIDEPDERFPTGLPFWYGHGSKGAESPSPPTESPSPPTESPSHRLDREWPEQAKSADDARGSSGGSAGRLVSRRSLLAGLVVGGLVGGGALWLISRLGDGDASSRNGDPAASGNQPGAQPAGQPGSSDGAAAPSGQGTRENGDPALSMSAAEWENGGPIPARFTCDGLDITPQLFWTAVPPGTEEYVLIMEDLDAGGFVHWLVFGMPASERGLSEDQEIVFPQGRNDFGASGYRGPCPPPGETHRYRLTLSALNVETGLAAGASATEFRAATEGGVIESFSWIGTYTGSEDRAESP